ncbi:MAG: hypothetical protein JNM93_11030 [Bacteriovoracaceae bacterium]|nr:hypothetical protein [Bacteriovoracaceae bacterium]
MKNFISLALVMLILVLIGQKVLDKLNQQVSIQPYPYTFMNNQAQSTIGLSPIVLMGDRLGVQLAKFLPIMSEELSVGLVNKIEISSLAQPHQALHRTLETLQHLEPKPKIVIYQGAAEEFYEKIFETKDGPLILRNIHRYNDPFYQSLFYFAPFMTHFLYKEIQKVPLSTEPQADKEPYLSPDRMLRTEIAYKLFELHLDELVRYSKKHNILLILMTTPINLLEEPRNTCEAVTSEEITTEIVQIKALIEKKDHKQAYARAKTLASKSPGHARAFYVYGLMAKKIGENNEALQALEVAASFDCEPWRGSPVFNQIIRDYARKHDVFLFDFQQMLMDEWNDNIVFFDEQHPQNFYYERASKAMAKVLRKVLKL